MENNKAFGAKQAVQNMLFYYLSSLMEISDDPKQIIASEIGAMINLSEEQIEYVKLSLASDNKVISNFNLCIQLLDNMKDKESFDLESINIIKNILSLMRDTCNKTLKDIDFGKE